MDKNYWLRRIDRDKTYYDVTHQFEQHDDDRGIGEITWSETCDCWMSEKYDDIFTDAELAEGLAAGWAVETVANTEEDKKGGEII